MKRTAILLSLLIFPLFAAAQDWPQWCFNAQHDTHVSIVGQSINQNLVNIVYDPLVAEEQAQYAAVFGDPDLVAHFQDPLVDGNDVYMEFKQGPYDFNNFATQTWGEIGRAHV